MCCLLGVIFSAKKDKRDGSYQRPQDRHNNEHFYHDNEKFERYFSPHFAICLYHFIPLTSFFFSGTHQKVSDVVVVNVKSMDVITNTLTFPTGVYITQVINGANAAQRGSSGRDNFGTYQSRVEEEKESYFLLILSL